MGKKSPFYKSPLLYILGLKWIHRGNFAKRYQFMASFVKKGDLVLEPACGPGILANFLPEGAYYRGFDTNKAFVNHALKKHPGVYLGDVLDPKSYCPADVVVVCDILHHLKPAGRKVFIKYCFNSAREKLIICEPGRDRSQKSVFSPLSKFWFEYIERDGTNTPKLSDFWSKEELRSNIEHGFGIIPGSVSRELREMGEDLIVVYFKKA